MDRTENLIAISIRPLCFRKTENPTRYVLMRPNLMPLPSASVDLKGERLVEILSSLPKTALLAQEILDYPEYTNEHSLDLIKTLAQDPEIDIYARLGEGQTLLDLIFTRAPAEVAKAFLRNSGFRDGKLEEEWQDSSEKLREKIFATHRHWIPNPLLSLCRHIGDYEFGQTEVNEDIKQKLSALLLTPWIDVNERISHEPDAPSLSELVVNTPYANFVAERLRQRAHVLVDEPLVQVAYRKVAKAATEATKREFKEARSTLEKLGVESSLALAASEALKLITDRRFHNTVLSFLPPIMTSAEDEQLGRDLARLKREGSSEERQRNVRKNVETAWEQAIVGTWHGLPIANARGEVPQYIAEVVLKFYNAGRRVINEEFKPG